MGELKSSGKSFEISKWEVQRAWEKVWANKGAAGVDGCSLEEFEADLKNQLYKIWNRMSSGSYFPPPVLAVEIPKPHGDGVRILGVPTVADRVAQTVVAARLEEKVEPIFHSDSYGYRPARSALDAVGVCRRRCWKYDWVIDLDIQKFFDSVSWDLIVNAVEAHTDVPWVLLYVKRWLRAPVQQADGTLTERDRGTPQGSAVTPPTQWAMWLMVVLQVATVGAFGVTGDAFPDRDAVSDGDLVGSDEDVLDEQSEHPLALLHRGDLGVGVELSEETLQIGGEGEVGLAVGELGVESINLVVQVGFSRAQVGHPGAQFVDSNQLLAVGLDHAGDRGGRLGQRGVEAFTLSRNGIGGAGGVESLVDLGADEPWVGQQPGEVIPHHLVEVVGADGFVGAHPAALVAVVV